MVIAASERDRRSVRETDGTDLAAGSLTLRLQTVATESQGSYLIAATLRRQLLSIE